jgi:hypothetical protein
MTELKQPGIVCVTSPCDSRLSWLVYKPKRRNPDIVLNLAHGKITDTPWVALRVAEAITSVEKDPVKRKEICAEFAKDFLEALEK